MALSLCQYSVFCIRTVVCVFLLLFQGLFLDRFWAYVVLVQCVVFCIVNYYCMIRCWPVVAVADDVCTWHLLPCVWNLVPCWRSRQDNNMHGPFPSLSIPNKRKKNHNNAVEYTHHASSYTRLPLQDFNQILEII